MPLNLKVGDRVYLDGRMRYMTKTGEVVKITPAGYIDVQYVQPSGTVSIFRFNEHGYGRSGEAKDDELKIDPTPFEERVAREESAKRAELAAGKINAVAPIERLRGTWGKDALMAEVARLQVLLDEAKAAVEAI